MPPTTLNDPNPLVQSSQSMDDETKPFVPLTPEQKRITLQKALNASPNDPRLLQAKARLCSPFFVQEAAVKGVFINYTRADELFTFELASSLIEAGIRVWIDMIDVTVGGDWRSEVTAALNTCGLMISVLSPDALADEEARMERQHFRAAGKLVIPVIARRCDLSGSDFWVKPVDFSRDQAAGLAQLLRIISLAHSQV